ncbi:hypothetical protein [Microbulbifer rhizosphaerae]|uniref:Uncharacterized protein n=1 Tax=Microbulbifer rhizosphaerae TaxID=1562603 RepID=A0A7W4Z7L9_9GAMM|nr:hypothetical protein [Microbulbifer rhizosphaerae]MBB3059893.1 hypothetical protein [Microbulbifer rhizosphaerae]
MKKRMMILLLLIAVPLATIAGTPPFQGCQRLACVGKIDRIYLHPEGNIKITPPIGANGSDTSVLGCSLSEGVYATIKRSHPHFTEMYSMLLAAHMSGKDVYVRILENSPDCEVWYTSIY